MEELQGRTLGRRLIQVAVAVVTVGCLAGVVVQASTGREASQSNSSDRVAATAERDGIRVTWNAVPNAKSYVVFRQQVGSAEVEQVNTAPVSGTSLLDVGLTPGVRYTYGVSTGATSVAAASRVAATSTVATASATATDPLAAWASQLNATCPATTSTTVTTVKELRQALSSVQPGQTIRLAPGTYSGNFTLERGGTSQAPVWICGPRTAVLDGADIRSGAALRLNGVSHVNLAGFTVQNALQGVMVKHSDHVTVTGLRVRQMGYEGVHLYAFTTDSVVHDNEISDTGSVDVAYGEGVYIGTSGARWGEVTGGKPDTTSRIAVVDNTIDRAGAEPVEAKAGTSDGVISGNVISDHQPGSRAKGWVLVTGNDWLVRNNTGSRAVTNGYVLMKSGRDWGLDNVVVGNSGRVDADGWGVLVHKPGSPVAAGTIIGCDNLVTGARLGLTHVPCQR